MHQFLNCLIIVIFIVFCSNVEGDVADTKIVRARLESCPGCQLNRLPEVRKFVYEDFPKYENAEFKKIQGAPPQLLFLNEADEIVEEHSLKNLNREECNNLLQNRGFVMKTTKEL